MEQPNSRRSLITTDAPGFWSHKTVSVHKNAAIGNGTKIWHHSQILKGARIGERCTIGHNCLVGSRAILGNGVKLQSNIDVWDLVRLEDDVFVGPSAVFTNDLSPRAAYPKLAYHDYGTWLPTLVKKGASLGANATILAGVTIGAWAMIGAGSVVTRDVPDYALMRGVPARIRGWVCECGNSLDFQEDAACCLVCKKCYRKDANIVKLKR